jgi:hypothetical protein
MRILKILLVLLVLGAIVAGFLAWTLPADVAYRYGTKYLGPVVLTGVRGTVWDGHADGISVLGRDLGEIDWHAQKIPLLRGQFVADAAGVLTRSSDGSLLAHDLRFSVPAELIAPAIDLRSLKLLGTISGVLTQATFASSALSDASGTARWSQAGVTGAAEARFSDMLADFASQADGSISGNVRDDGNGNLAVDGTFKVSFSAFDAQATLKARNGDQQVADTLRYVGQPQPDGSSKLVVHGQMLKVL